MATATCEGGLRYAALTISSRGNNSHSNTNTTSAIERSKTADQRRLPRLAAWPGVSRAMRTAASDTVFCCDTLCSCLIGNAAFARWRGHLTQFPAEQCPRAFPQSDEGRRMPDRRVARTRQIDVENLFDTSRPASHDRHAIGQKDGLVDAMGNEHHRGCALLPDAEQFLLQRLACLRIERAKG